MVGHHIYIPSPFAPYDHDRIYDSPPISLSYPSRTTMKLQPGPRYLLSSPGLFLPPFALWLTRLTFDFVWIPTWLWTLVLLTSPFTFFALKWYINSWRHDLAARRHGAIRPPLVPTKWPGSTDIVYRMFQLDKKAYLGACCCLLNVLVN